jgi:hypothetical protein
MNNSISSIQSAQRPTFLSVLCILTFIGSVLTIAGSVYALTQGSTEEVLVSQGRMMQALRSNAMVGIISSVLTLIGAVFMWELSKTGFWIYAIGASLGIIFPFLLFSGNIFLNISGMLGAIFGLLFLVLYYLNYKHLKN